MGFGGRYDCKSLGDRCFVDDFETEDIDFVGLIAIKFNLWWIELNVDVAVSFLKCICNIEE
jgi:hypothetical protein